MDISSLQSLLINHQELYSVYATVMDLCGFCGVQHLGYNREDMIAPASVFKAFLLYNLWWKSYKISLWMKSVHSQDLGYCIVGEVCSLHTTSLLPAAPGLGECCSPGDWPGCDFQRVESSEPKCSLCQEWVVRLIEADEWVTLGRTCSKCLFRNPGCLRKEASYWKVT